ncbi:methyltransferase domain-containing protein [Luteimonas sp. RD2P54]|uniref:Small RNA 2'-O-methyltransferase n=1 Tax=Luteimonas endophytica TaxID=3042023 RepID=A0ABT6JCB2_9GAMM|nr:methyltransferase domain-containing protein [Luteimonas endophytica]MDH5823808.1 methyltransferase domain-containing protein [Luteimonas endophytica]
MEEATLHEQRLDLVTALLLQSGATSVLDLGCGAGRLLARLLPHPRFDRITGVDLCTNALAVARSELGDAGRADPRLRLMHGDCTRPLEGLAPHEAAVLVETIEHLDPGLLSGTERALFGHHRPRLAIVTTPNREYNVLYGLAEREVRDPDHRFEWDRTRFRAWAGGVARRNGYAVRFGGIGKPHLELGAPGQYACFTRTD